MTHILKNVRIYIYIYTYVCLHVYSIHIYIYMHITHVCVCVHSIRTQYFIRICVDVYLFVFICTYINVSIAAPSKVFVKDPSPLSLQDGIY